LKITAHLCSLTFSELSVIHVNVVHGQLLPLSNWVAASCDLTTQLMPNFVGRWFGPADYLSNLRFCEFDAAERMLHFWLGDPDNMEALWQFVAILYRPARTNYDHKRNPEGDVREPFNGNLTLSNATEMQKRLPVSYAYAVVLWYKGCRAYISDRFTRIFNAPEADQSEVPGEPAYFGLMRSIAKEGIYGSFADVEQLYLYTALTEMDAALDEQEAIKAAMKDAEQNAKNS